MKPKDYIISFDSSTSMLSSLGGCLQGRDFSDEHFVPHLPDFITKNINELPTKAREFIYRWSGWFDAIPADKLSSVDEESVSKWVVAQYPETTFPGIMIGSSNGAAIHIGAALGMPWLPQTFLITSRRHMDPDELVKDMEWGEKHVGPVLERNPNLQAHQMHDPVQDRLMVERTAYFRMKRLTLGKSYEDFVESSLCRDGRLVLIDCRYKWPATRVGERHYFQVGGLGEISAEEYHNGSDRVRRFLEERHSSREKWKVPQPTGTEPEAEWGFVNALGDDVERFAGEHNMRVERLVFDCPEDLSPFVADLYLWWYKRRGLPVNKLIVECFAFVEPWWTMRSGAIPFWSAFNTESSAAVAMKYLKGRERFEQIYLLLMANGVKGIGSGLTAWRKIIELATVKGEMIGINQDDFPADLESFFRYHKELKQKIPAVGRLPEPLTFAEFYEFIDSTEGNYKVRYERS